MRLNLPVRSATRTPLVQMIKTAVAAVLAWVVAGLLVPGEFPVFATVAALIVIQPSVNQSYAKAFERSLGVILGVLIALGAVLAFGEQSWLVLLATVVAIVSGWVLRLTATSSTQIAISAMLVLSIGAATPEYAVIRIFETLIGAAVALVINALIVPPVLAAPARLAIARLGREEADRIDDLARVLGGRPDRSELDDLLRSARELRALRTTAGDAVQRGMESLAFNPTRSRHRDQLNRDAALFTRLDPLVTRIVGMTRTTRDRWDNSLAGTPAIDGIAEELRRAAHDLRLLVRFEGDRSRADQAGAELTEELPALTRPMAVIGPAPEQWILLGALMEDLRRIREEIVGE